MPLVVLVLVLVVLIGLSLWSSRRTRHKLLGGSSLSTTTSAPGVDPHRTANETRAVIDAEGARGNL